MYDSYLITGATGFLGRTIVKELVEKGAQVQVLVMAEDPYTDFLPKEVQVIQGDVRSKCSLDRFFSDADSRTCVIHCAGIVSIASHHNPVLYQVNVIGTWNIIQQCLSHDVGMLIYVSSVHAIPEQPDGILITEDCKFSPALVNGDYAKSKAVATKMIFSETRRGLRASVVFPSGIIGPGDVQNGSITSMVKSFLAGRLPLAISGGYDFVDVRDVAKGILSCSEMGEFGKGYILSGQYLSIRRMLSIIGSMTNRRSRFLCLPLNLARLVAPYYEDRCLKRKEALFFTPYSVEVLSSNARFSHAAATEKLSYYPRMLEETLRDMTIWLRRQQEENKSP